MLRPFASRGFDLTRSFTGIAARLPQSSAPALHGLHQDAASGMGAKRARQKKRIRGFSVGGRPVFNNGPLSTERLARCADRAIAAGQLNAALAEPRPLSALFVQEPTSDSAFSPVTDSRRCVSWRALSTDESEMTFNTVTKDAAPCSPTNPTPSEWQFATEPFTTVPGTDDRTFALRAEAVSDVLLLLRVLNPCVERMCILPFAKGSDVFMKFTLHEGTFGLQQLRWVVSQLTDLHVAAESLAFAHEYSGERRHGARGVRPSKSMLKLYTEGVMNALDYHQSMVEELEARLTWCVRASE